MTEELTKIADDMAALLPLFVNGGSTSGFILPTEHATNFKALAMEAKSILDAALGHANDYSLELRRAANSCDSGFISGPSYRSVEEASKLIKAAIRTIDRKGTKSPSMIPSEKPYVDPARIAALRAIDNSNWDFKRLVELCQEINVAAANRCHMSTAMLLRSILDHVPPVFGFNTFKEVANNYGGPKSQRSLKASMQRLEGSLRNIADMHLHSPIRQREDVPTATQVEFRADLDVVMGELIRVATLEQT